MMRPIRLFLALALMISILSACSLFDGNDTQTAMVLATPSLAPTTIELTVQADAAALTAAGQVIKYTYTIKNTGVAAVPGNFTLAGATCPSINAVGNLDGNFDPGETAVCTFQYAVTQPDIDKGSVANVATANVNGINSNVVTTTINKSQPSALNLTKTASPLTYDQVGQIITYTYVILNSGGTALGPAQFTVTDTGFSTPFNCGDAAATLAPNATLTCAAIYAITQADLDRGSVATSATASGGGAAASPPASVTLTKKGSVVVTPPPNNSSLTAGSTIQHKVVTGEWLWQIARCYGADPAKTVQANPQLADPKRISPDTIVTVPNIGSAGRIYGPPCVGTHTVLAGETWASIAQKYNADVLVLQIVNGNDLTVGRVLKVPLNSAGVALPAK